MSWSRRPAVTRCSKREAEVVFQQRRRVASSDSGESLEKARAHGLLLLKFRPRSEAEFRSRLSQRGYSPATVEALVEEFKRKDLIDDAKFARYFATQRMTARPSGRRALMSDLKAKGLDPDLATKAVEEATEGRGDLEVARELAKRRLPILKSLDRAAIQRRLFGYLSRRGFSSDVVYRVVRETVECSTEGEA